MLRYACYCIDYPIVSLEAARARYTTAHPPMFPPFANVLMTAGRDSREASASRQLGLDLLLRVSRGGPYFFAGTKKSVISCITSKRDTNGWLSA